MQYEWRKYCRKNSELVHPRGRVEDAWKVILKERDPEGEDTANARAKELRRHIHIRYSSPSLILLKKIQDVKRTVS
jgi:hypothetical protein